MPGQKKFTAWQKIKLGADQILKQPAKNLFELVPVLFNFFTITNVTWMLYNN